MKRINLPLFLLLFMAATAAQSVNAGPWGWFKEKVSTVCYAPVSLMSFTARYVWENIRPVTKAELNIFEEKQKEEITEQADKAIKYANSNHKAANEKYAVLNTQQKQLQDKAGILHKKAQKIQSDVSGLGDKLEDMNSTHNARTLQLQEKIDQVKKQKIFIEEIMKSVEAQCKKRAEQAKELEQELLPLKEDMIVVSGLINQCTDQMYKQSKAADLKKNLQKIALITDNWKIDFSRDHVSRDLRCGLSNKAIEEKY